MEFYNHCRSASNTGIGFSIERCDRNLNQSDIDLERLEWRGIVSLADIYII